MRLDTGLRALVAGSAAAGAVLASPACALAAETSLGAVLPLYTVVPFVALLLCIAFLPLSVPHWWEQNANKGIVSALCAVPVALYLVTFWGNEGAAALEHVTRGLLLVPHPARLTVRHHRAASTCAAFARRDVALARIRSS